MLRYALRLRWLGLLGLVLVFATVFAWLGNWQLNRARQNATPVTINAARPLTEVLAPQQALPPAAGSTPVIVDGDLQADQTVIITGRVSAGQPVRWLVAPVVVTTADGTPARLPLVVGSIPPSGPVPALTDRPVRLQAMLQPSELPGDTTFPDTTTSVSSADLVARWGPPLYSGFVFADQATATAQGVTAVPPPDPQPDKGFAVLNLSYALQWWLFAAFAGYIWFRALRDRYRADLADGEPASAPVPASLEQPPADRSSTTSGSPAS